jgi:hypothetical protein
MESLPHLKIGTKSREIPILDKIRFSPKKTDERPGL